MTTTIEKKNELIVMDHTGDTKSIWNPDNADEVSAARSLFNSLRGKGHIAYRVEKDGKAGGVLNEFDPQAGKIIMRPPASGG